ncbi:MAG TPA: hypothetical protein VGF99_06205, partial [Myxococcota bacterium]
MIVVVIAALLTTAAPAAHVLEAHDGVAYLDAGSRAGLVVGARIDVVRDGAVVGQCTVVDVGDTRASCRSDSFAIARDDTVALSPPPPSSSAPSRRSAVPSTQTLSSLSAATSAHVPTLVAHTKKQRRAPRWRDGGHVRVSTFGAVSPSLPGTTSLGVSVDAGMRTSLEPLTGVVGSFARAAVRATSDVSPSSPDRFRPGTVFEPYVFDAVVGIDSDAQPLRLFIGRFASAQAPGLPTIDGVQAGWGFGRRQRLEIGGFVGTVPDLTTTAPTTRPTVGVYATARQALPGGWQLLPRARAGLVVDTFTAGLRADSEADVTLLGGTLLWVSASARLSSSSTSSARTAEALSLTRAHVDGEATLLPWWQVFGGFRHVGPAGVDVDLATVARTGNDLLAAVSSSRHVDLGMRFPLSFIVPSLQVGVVEHDLGSVTSRGTDAADVLDLIEEGVVVGATRRGFVTAGVDLPRVLGDVVGAGITAQQELGTGAGRFVALHLLLRPLPRASVVVRG